MVRTGMFSIFDQGVVSGTNFLTTLILARACSQEELGVYSLAWTIVLFLAAVQGNLITVPYTMYCHRRSGAALAEYAGSTLAHQLITSLAAVACFLGLSVLLSLGFGPARLRPAAWVLLGVIPFLLLREYARRFTFAHLALATAITIDVVVAVLQLGTLLVLRQLGLLSAAAVYGAMGGGLRRRLPVLVVVRPPADAFLAAGFCADWRRNWSFGKWALMSQLTGLAFYVLPWMLAAVHGEAETGELAACSTLVGLSNLFVMGLNNFLMPKAARAFASGGPHALVRRAAQGHALRRGRARRTVRGRLLRRQSPGGDRLREPICRHRTVDHRCSPWPRSPMRMGLTASIGLWAMDRPAASIAGDVVQLVVTLGVALWLVFPLGAMGIAIAMVVGRTAGAAVRWLTIRLLLDEGQLTNSVTA